MELIQSLWMDIGVGTIRALSICNKVHIYQRTKSANSFFSLKGALSIVRASDESEKRFLPPKCCDYVLVEFLFKFGTIRVAQHRSMSHRSRSKLWE